MVWVSFKFYLITFHQHTFAYGSNGMRLSRSEAGDANRSTLEDLLRGNVAGLPEIVEPAQSQTNADEADVPAGLEWATTEYLYDLTQEYYQVISETTTYANGTSATTAYAYGLERIAAYSENGVTRYVYDGRGSVAQAISAPVAGEAATSALPDISVKVQSFAYTAYGEQMGNVKVSGFTYNAEAYDAATGMLNLRARQYEPAVGRFGQKDIVRGTAHISLSINRYLFVINSPICYLDPTGRDYTPAKALALGKGPITKEHYNRLMSKQELKKPNIKSMSINVWANSFRIVSSRKLLEDAGKKYNKMSDKEKVAYNGAVAVLNHATEQRPSSSSARRKTEQEIQAACERLITERYRTELTNAREDFERLINLGKLNPEYKNMVLSMVNTALLDNAQNSGDITEIIQATQLMNARSKDVVVLYESAMKEEIRTVTGKYLLSDWEKADFEERKTILEAYMNELTPIYGVSVKPSIYFIEFPDSEYGTAFGRRGILPDGNSVLAINVMYLKEALPAMSFVQLFDTIRHELRHVYQHEAIMRPDEFIVSNTTLNEWRENELNYNDPYTDLDDYYSQVLEVDANNFADLNQ